MGKAGLTFIAIFVAAWLARPLVAGWFPDGIVYTSTTTVLGAPLVDIQLPSQASLRAARPIADGWIAIGMVGEGRLLGIGAASCGLVAAGPLAVGAISTGVLAIGVAAAGVIAIGWKRRGVTVVPSRPGPTPMPAA